MGDTKITSSVPSTAQTTQADLAEVPAEIQRQAEAPTTEHTKDTANASAAMKKAGAETRGFMDTQGEFLKRSLGEQIFPPPPRNELARRLEHADPKAAEQFGKDNQQLLHQGIMQFSSPLAVPKFAKGITDIKLTDEQKQAKADLEQSPAWKALSDTEKTQITKNLSKLSGKQLSHEGDLLKERFKAIETLSARSAWGELSPRAQESISDQVLKLSGNQLKNEMTKVGGQFDSIEKLSRHAAWGVLSPEQKGKLTDPMLKLSGDKRKQHITQTQERLDSLKTLSDQPSWKDIDSKQQQSISDHILKTTHANLSQTTQNVQSTMNFVASLKKNGVDPGNTLDKLLKLEAQGPKSFVKMTSAFTEAGKQIDAAKDKKTVATDIKDMVNFSLDRGVASKKYPDSIDGKGEIVNRFLTQYKSDPSDFGKVRDLLKNSPNALLLVHWHHPDKIGVDIRGTKPVTDADLNKATIPAGEATRYKHAIGNLHEREGKYDDMNAYDDGIISIGFRQWSTHQGSLYGPMEELKKANPTKFAALFPGITMQSPETILYNGKSLHIGPGRDVKAILTDLKQSELLELSDMFNKAGKDADFQTAQLQVGVNRINDVLGFKVGTHKIGDYVKSDRGLGQIVSFDAGRPGWIKDSFTAGVKDVAGDLGLSSAAPSRQDMLDTLKLKLEGDKTKKIEPDKDFVEKLQQKYGKDILDKLKTPAGREEFLEKRLTEAFRDHLIATDKAKFGAADAQRFRERFKATETYYDKL